MNPNVCLAVVCGTLAMILMVSSSAHSQSHPWPLKEFVLVKTADDKDACSITTTEGECLTNWGKLPDSLLQADLEGDLDHAASFYEKHGFLPPYLEDIRIAELAGTLSKVVTSLSDFPKLAELGDEVVDHQVHPIRALTDEFEPGPSEGIAMYLSNEACLSAEARRAKARNYLSQGGAIPAARGRSLNRRNGPSIVSDPIELAGNSAAVLKQALPHELFHSVQFAYPSIQNEHCGAQDDWYLEGMTEAMSLSWLKERHPRLISDRNQRRIRGWRAYNYPLHEPYAPSGPSDAREKLYQSYGTSSFWRYLGIKGIRRVLEFKPDGGYDNLVERLDDAIKTQWSEVCKNVMTNKEGELGLPAFKENEERISCSDVSEYAGLYLLYPLFMAKFVKSERKKKDALSHIFPDKPGQGASLQRKDGCFDADLGEGGSVLTLSPIASECIRLPAELDGRMSVVAEFLSEPRLGHLFLSWKGEVHAGFYLPERGLPMPSSPPRIKYWIDVGTEQLPLTGSKGSSDDVLLVFSNVAPKPLQTKEMRLRITFVKDGGEKFAKLY